MRRWLLACVGILLVADGYWASENLVLKSADDGIYWFAFSSEDGVLEIESFAGKQLGFVGKAKPNITWVDGNWYLDGELLPDIAQFIEYINGPHTPCVLSYSLPGNPTIQTAISSIEDAFRTGAADAIIMAPVPRVSSQFQNLVSAYEAPSYSNKTCPHAAAWREVLDYGEQGFGYPPNVKAAKKAN